MNIALIRLSAIGDCCLVLPVVRAILQQKPEAHIHWLIGKAAYELLQYSTHPRLTFKVIEKPKSLSDYKSIRNYFNNKEIDTVLAMQASTRANLIYPMIRAKTKIGFDRVRARELQWLFTNKKIPFANEHLHDSFCQFAKQLGVNTEQLDWSIQLQPDLEKNLVERFAIGEDYIVINPAASKLERSWQEEKYAMLIDWLTVKHKLKVILTGGVADFELKMAKHICDLTQNKPLNLVGKTSLSELAVVLKSAQLVVAPDTGPAHIANAVGTPVIGLYAVAPGRLSAPYKHKDLLIDKFEDAVKNILGKDPKTVPWKTRVHDRAAMDLISFEEVAEKINQALSIN